MKVIIRDGQAYPEGDLEHPLDVPVPQGADREMIMASRPNAIELGAAGGYQTHIQTRIFLTDRTEYVVPIGNQTLKVQTPHQTHFPYESCSVRFVEPMWYPVRMKMRKERQRAMLIQSNPKNPPCKQQV